ncbi:MAG: hypothetical protein HKN20_09100, partial [Gemmatimonadetes bacterium]|nr:hypothetical protein [Gemmatimonadota bacterium]
PFWKRWYLNGHMNLARDSNWQTKYPDSRLLMEPVEELRLEAALELEGPWANVRAGDVQSALGPNDLTLYERNAFGLHGALFTDDAQLDLVGARAKGEVFYQTPTDSLGIRADGTAGPYRLAHSPIVRGSETVYIEVRDRFDPTIVRERTPQTRLIDYTVDYARGVVTFQEPIASETFDDHHVYIAIQYSYDSRESGYERYLAAGRGETTVLDRATVGMTYATEIDDAGSWEGGDERPMPLRHHAYGADLDVTVVDGTSVRGAYARSDTGQWGKAARNEAVTLGFDSHTFERLRLHGDYKRFENAFEPISNNFLVGQKDKERWDVGLELDVSAAVGAHASQRVSRDLRAASDGRQLRDRSHIAGTELRGRTGVPDFRGEVEIRDRYDENDRNRLDDRRTTTRWELADDYARFDWAARYENEQFDQRGGEGGAEETIHRFKISPRADLGAGFAWAAEAKSELTKDRVRGLYREHRAHYRTELEFRAEKRLSALGAWEGSRTVDLEREAFGFGGGTPREHAYGYSVGANWRPFRRWETTARYENQRTRDDMLAVIRNESETYRHELFFVPHRDLEFHGEFVFTDLEDVRKIGVTGAGSRRRDREYLFDVNYNYDETVSLTTGFHFHERNIFDPFATETWVRRVFAGVNAHFLQSLEGTAELQYAWLDGEPIDHPDGLSSIENQRLRYLFELALDIRTRGRLALGYEGVDYEEPSTADAANDFMADRAYLKLITRF